METEFGRMALKPSALVLRELSAYHSGNALGDALEQAGFSRSAVNRYLEQRAARCATSNGSGGCSLS